VIRDDMKDTHQDLTENLEKLEERVTDSLSAAEHSVTDTVETVKKASRRRSTRSVTRWTSPATCALTPGS